MGTSGVSCTSFGRVCNSRNTCADVLAFSETLETSRPRISITEVMRGTSPNPLDQLLTDRTKLLIEDYVAELTSSLLYLYSLPSPNSQTSNFPQSDDYTPPVTSISPTQHHSPTLIHVQTSPSETSTKSLPPNIAPPTFFETNSSPTLSFQEKKSFFLQSRQTFGSTALVLQGGSVFGLCHVGVVRGLWKRGLLPRIFVGWGVGGIIASLGMQPPLFEGKSSLTGKYVRKRILRCIIYSCRAVLICLL